VYGILHAFDQRSISIMLEEQVTAAYSEGSHTVAKKGNRAPSSSTSSAGRQKGIPYLNINVDALAIADAQPQPMIRAK
jgi:hypothetical protein